MHRLPGLALLITAVGAAAACTTGGPDPEDITSAPDLLDQVDPAEHTNVFLPDNVQTTAGWLAGLEEADKSGHY